MRIVLIGATGMVGEGVLRACLRARDVNDIIVISRRALPDYDDPRLKVFITPPPCAIIFLASPCCCEKTKVPVVLPN